MGELNHVFFKAILSDINNMSNGYNLKGIVPYLYLIIK